MGLLLVSAHPLTVAGTLTPAGSYATEGEDQPAGWPRWRSADRRTWLGRLAPVVAIFAALVALDAAGAGIQRPLLAASWQLVDLQVLGDDPLGSVWHLHTQPPLHNLLVGLVVAGPFPVDGTLFVLYGACLVGIALLLHDLLVHWGVGPLTAGWITAVALVHPSLLGTLRLMSYEIPVALMVVAAVWTVARYLATPTTGWLLAVAGVLTTGALTRSVLHPAWVLAVLGACWLARSVTRRQVLASLAIPVVLLGGWALKNQVLFGTPTLSSWQGFNLQRGIVAPMERDVVERDVAAGHVSSLALEYPWMRVHRYAAWTDGCTPTRDHPAAAEAEKHPYDGQVWINYNHQCYLPAYRQARSDAVRLVLRHPGRYLTTRAAPLAASFSVPGASADDDTWMDDLLQPLHPKVGVTFDMTDWNLPFLGQDRQTFDVSLLLVGLTAFTLGRGALATGRLARTWRDRRTWPADEVVWVIAALAIGWVVIGGDLVEFGENDRFRTTVDPLLLALPLGALARTTQRWWAQRLVPAAARSGDP